MPHRLRLSQSDLRDAQPAGVRDFTESHRSGVWRTQSVAQSEHLGELVGQAVEQIVAVLDRVTCGGDRLPPRRGSGRRDCFIDAPIQCHAYVASRVPQSGSNRSTARMSPTAPDCTASRISSPLKPSSIARRATARIPAVIRSSRAWRSPQRARRARACSSADASWGWASRLLMKASTPPACGRSHSERVSRGEVVDAVQRVRRWGCRRCGRAALGAAARGR